MQRFRAALPITLATSIAAAAAAGAAAWGGADESPVELGRVRWQRDFDAASAASKQSGKPLAVLFQEVPG